MLPKRQLERIQHCLMMVRVTDENRVAWRLDAEPDVARINRMRTEAEETLALYNRKNDPRTATLPVLHQFQVALEKMTIHARRFQHWIKGNELVPDDILINFKIGARNPGKHHRRPVPNDVPVNTVEHVGLNTLKIGNFQMEEGGKRLTIRDRNNERVIRRYAITPHGQPLPADIDTLPWVTMQADRNMRHTISLSPAFNGMTFNLQTAFSNDSGQGPWSDLYRVTIS